MADRDSYDRGRDYYGGPDYTRDEFERGYRRQRGREWDEERYDRERQRGREGDRGEWPGEYDRWEGEWRSGRSPYGSRDYGEHRGSREGGPYGGRPDDSWQERPTYYRGGGYGVGRSGSAYRGDELDRTGGRYRAEGSAYGRGGYQGGAQYGESPYGPPYGASPYERLPNEASPYGGSGYEGSPYEGSRYEASRYGYGASGYGARGSELWRGGRPRRYIGRGPKGYRRSNERILEEANEILTMHPDIDASDVEVEVTDGVVTLRGVVEDRLQKRMAEDVVEEIFGVADVRNELKVRHGFLATFTGEKASDREIQRTTAREERETKPRGARPS